MAKLLYSATMSLDGFIAGPRGDMSWLAKHLGGANPEVDELVGDIGAILAGANTWRGEDPNAGTPREGAFDGRWDGPQFVLTHHIPQQPVSGITFVDDVKSAVSKAKAAAGEKKYVNVLGATVAKACLDSGVLDEVLVLIAPVMLGDGVRLFDYPGGAEVELERLSISHTAQVTNLWFRVG